MVSCNHLSIVSLFYHGKQLFELRYKGFLHVILGEAFGCQPHRTGCGRPVPFPVLEIGFGEQGGDTAHLAPDTVTVYLGIVGSHDGVDEIPVGNGIAVQYGLALVGATLYGKGGEEVVQPHDRNLGGRTERPAVCRIGGGKTG